jgi:hypothetical protein
MRRANRLERCEAYLYNNTFSFSKNIRVADFATEFVDAPEKELRQLGTSPRKDWTCVWPNGRLVNDHQGSPKVRFMPLKLITILR